LLYDYNWVIAVLKMKCPTWKMVSEWYVKDARQEFILRGSGKQSKRKKIADVIWRMEKINKDGIKLEKYIVHEIKTGWFDINKEFRLYESCYIGKDHVTGNAQLWIWGRSDVLKKQRQRISDKLKLKINYGKHVRLIPLEWIFSIVEQRLSELGFKRVEKRNC